MSKNKKSVEAYSGKVFPVGAAVFLKRPNLHFGYSGKIMSVNEKTGEHLVRLTHRGEIALHSEFGALASGTEMEAVK